MKVYELLETFNHRNGTDYILEIYAYDGKENNFIKEIKVRDNNKDDIPYQECEVVTWGVNIGSILCNEPLRLGVIIGES